MAATAKHNKHFQPRPKPKISGPDAVYVLLVRWLPAYRQGKAEYAYYSNPPENCKNGTPVQELLRRVLLGTATARYEWAVLKDNQTDTPMRAWRADGTEISVNDWKTLKAEGAPPCLFKFWVLPNKMAPPELLRYCKGETAKGITWRSHDECTWQGQAITGPEAAISNLLDALQNIRGGYQFVNIYDSTAFGTLPLAVVNHQGALLVKDVSLRKQLSKTTMPPYKLGLFV